MVLPSFPSFNQKLNNSSLLITCYTNEPVNLSLEQQCYTEEKCFTSTFHKSITVSMVVVTWVRITSAGSKFSSFTDLSSQQNHQYGFNEHITYQLASIHLALTYKNYFINGQAKPKCKCMTSERMSSTFIWYYSVQVPIAHFY